VALDLDEFELVNELYGSGTGDEVIRALAGVCRRILRAFDLVGRVGGKEFVMLLPHLTAVEAEQTAERLRQAVGGLAVFKDDKLVSVTASVGFAGTERADMEFLSDLLAPAESAMRRAREDGGDRVSAALGDWSGRPRAEGH
jgi:diguanylate cyclase (GGDEF)-like protein